MCRSCGSTPREGARYCDKCGSALAAPTDAAEYKQVTALFADVVRSMDIAAALDIERLREVMTELVERAAGVARRYGGTVEYTGDGVMALFGAPIALEDHAFRACVAALAIQDEATRLADDVARRDGVELQVRVGLNSGRVIAGEIGSGSLGYAATGETVGFAQRMESAAPAGGVLLSESTAQLVEHIVTLADPEQVRIKGADGPVRAHVLLGIGPRDGRVGRAEANLVGRRWEMAALAALVERTIGGHGGVVMLVGAPGIGKSRVARQAAALAADHGAAAYWTFCESHARDVPFFAVTRLLRAGLGVADADDETARARVREQIPDADPQDLLLLDELLGIADPEVTLPPIDPDAKRRRLTALVNTATLARTAPALYVIEDAHWIDAASESMLADFLSVVARTPSMVLITARPEYQGALAWTHGAQSVGLAPLGDTDTATLLTELLGPDPSVAELAAVIVERASGNPFFAEEMVRELAQRGVLTGRHGDYLCRADVAEVSVPPTVQAAIEARIDRLTGRAKRTLTAASVIGARFEAHVLNALGIDPEFGELLAAELIDQVRFTPSAEYAFHHPLIRTVAYESQLKSDRAQTHRRVADWIQEHDPGSVEENAALIAEHLESAGDPHSAYGWHMRAATSSAGLDVDAARVSWERACRIADALPADDPARLPMRIAPRTMLCATDFHARNAQESRGRFEMLRELCDAADDKMSLAIGMTGLVTEHLFAGRPLEGARLVSEQMALLESIGDPNLTVGLAFQSLATWFDVGEFDEILRWSQTVIDLTEGDPIMGAGFGIGSPLAMALAFRGLARCWLGRPGWRDDVDDAVEMARNSDPTTLALVFAWAYGVGIVAGALRVRDSVLATIREAVASARRASSDSAVIFAEYALGGSLMYRDDATLQRRGLELTMRARDKFRERVPCLVPAIDVLIAVPEMAQLGAAIAVMRPAMGELRDAGRLAGGYGVPGTGIFIEALLQRGSESDLAEVQDEIARLADLAAEKRWAMLDVMVLRLRALLARAHGDDAAFRDWAGRYHALAESVGYEAHTEWAKAMIE
ncbi:cyclase [Mycolicibacterium moriokaense]|nr:cyclase [Mycolicibacterium moriokaense]